MSKYDSDVYLKEISLLSLDKYSEIYSAHSNDDVVVLKSILKDRLPDEFLHQIACNMIEEFGCLSAVVSQSMSSLIKVGGLTLKAIEGILATKEAMILIAEKRIFNKPALNNWETIRQYCRSTLAHQGKQSVLCIFLDEEYHPIRSEYLQKGTVSNVYVYPREIITRSLELDAAALIIAKSMPSGRLSPKPNEIEFIKYLSKITKPFDVCLLDFILVGATGERSCIPS